MSKKYFLLLIALSLLFFWAAWFIRPKSPLPGGREKTEMAGPDVKTEPLIALTTVALGGFRSLIVDILWLRLITIQAEGRVFEVAQLADWITRLEPEFPSVWAFHAWNMAYNISTLYSNPEHRWLWVKNGIQLLRDNGLKYNPHDPALYRELGWLYQHKIGQDWDTAHLYYKIKLAQEMTDLFGGTRPDYSQIALQTNHLQESNQDPPRPVATPPQEGSLAALGTRTYNPLLGGVREAGGGSESDRKKITQTNHVISMITEYKLYPEIMQAIEHEYGKLDWRLPEAHALYWAYCGLHEAAPGKDTSPCDHMIFQAMAEAFRKGLLFFDPKSSAYVTTPRLDLLPGVLKAYEEAIQRHDLENFKRSFVNFMSEAVFILHAYGRDRTARELFDKMLSFVPELRDKMSFEQYVRHYDDDVDVSELPLPHAVALIEGLLYQSYLDGTDKTKREELRKKAFPIWTQYTNYCKGLSRSTGLPPFALIEEQAKQRTEEKEHKTP